VQRIVRIAIGILSLALTWRSDVAAQAPSQTPSQSRSIPSYSPVSWSWCDEVDPGAWVRFEYLNLTVKSATLPAPLVTTGGSAGQGRLNAPDTTVLLGQPPAFGVVPGARLTVGGWVGGEEEMFGYEFTGFATALRAAHFNVASQGADGPLLAVPFANVTTNGVQESSLVVAQPGVRSGQIGLDDAIVLGGMECTALLSLTDFVPGDRIRLNLLGGIGLFVLNERMQFISNSVDAMGAATKHSDVFLTENTFFGGDFGARSSFRWRRFLIDVTGRTAVGVNSPTVAIAGENGLPFYMARPNHLAPEGFFAQPSNVGRFWAHNSFAVVPNAQFHVGYDLTKRLRLTVGYEALLWTSVLRAGNQIDRTLNLSQSTGPLVGPASPVTQAKSSTFWAQGFTTGFQLNF
jgi:hypothetical protein